MARTEHIKSARKTKNGNRPRCCTCGVAIEIGQSYYKNSPSRFSPTYSWHATCKAPAPSQLESNEKRSTAMAAQESAHESLDDLSGTENYDSLIDDIKSTLSACAAGFEEAAEMCRESASNIEDGFGHETESSMAQTEMADIYEEGASTLEDWEPDQTDVPGEDDVVDSDDPATDLTDLRNAWRDGVIESARQAIDDMEMP